MKKAAMILSITMMLIVTGCGKETQKPPVPSVPMETPQALVLKVVTAMQAGDRQSFLECFSVSQSEYDALEAMIETVESYITFESAFIKAYGQEAWDTFQDRDQAPDGADTTLIGITAEDVEQARQWKPQGDPPVFRFPNTSGPATIIKLDGGWVFQLGQMLGNPTETQLSQMAKTLRAMDDLVSKYSKAIGKENISGEDIDFQMGKEMMGMIGIGLKIPDRFDIDEVIKQDH